MNEIIELRNVYKTYTDRSFLKRNTEIHVLKNISLGIREGTTLGLVGESSSGKTTTTRLILGQEKPSGGEILFRGKNVEKLTGTEKKEYRSQVQVVFQNPYSSLDPSMKIKDIIEEPLLLGRQYTRPEIDEKVDRILEKVGLARSHLNRYSREFSGGQLQRIAIARALVNSPKLLVLDEPVSALDVSVRGQIMNLLKSIKEAGKITYVFISHDMKTVGFLSDTIAVMYFGHIVEYGTTSDILENYRHPYTEKLITSDMVRDLSEVEDENAEVPSYLNEPKGCPFASRCKYATEQCRTSLPEFRNIEGEHWAACHRTAELKFDNKISYTRPEYNI